MFNRNARRFFVGLPAFAAFMVSTLGKRTNRMPKVSYLSIAVMLVVCLSLAGPALNVSAGPLVTASTPSLGAAASFGILATDYRNFATPTTVITGDLGYANGLGSYLLAQVSGNREHASGAYNAAVSAQATALVALDAEQCETFLSGATDLSSLSPLTPGVYCVTGTASIGGLLTLQGSGTYIFRIDDKLTTGADSEVRAADGASACNVFWTRGKKDAQTELGKDSTFLGTVINPSGIQIDNNVTWTGRGLAAGGQVRTDADEISVPDCGPHLSVEKTNGVNSVSALSSTTYTVTVSNDGQTTVTGAKLKDPIATGLTKTLVVCSTTPGKCGPTAPTIAQLEGAGFTLPPLDPGDFYEIAVTAHVDVTSESVTNTARVEFVDGSNTSSDTDPVTPLSLVKSIVSGSPYHAVDDTIVYSYVVTNTGNLPVKGPFTITDDQATNEFCPTVVALDPGQHITCTATHIVTQADLTNCSLTNDATAHAGGGAVINSNEDQATATCEQIPAPSADLTINKTADTASIAAGAPITFTIQIQHTGTSRGDATNVDVTDILPPEVDFVSGPICNLGGQTPDQCTYNSATRTITAHWDTFSLQGGNGQISFVVRGIQHLACDSRVDNVAFVRWNEHSKQSGVTLYTSQGGQYGCGPLPPPPPLPHTGFLPGPFTELNSQPAAQYATDYSMSMDIPWLGISRMSIVGVPLADGTWNVDALGANAGWLETTALPGQSGNSVISGHVTDIYGWDGPFAQLDKLAAGDDILVHAYGQMYTYRVQWVRNVAPDDRSVLTDDGDTTLTLVTCSDPNYTTHTYDERLIVRAVLVQQSPEQ